MQLDNDSARVMDFRSTSDSDCECFAGMAVDCDTVPTWQSRNAINC